MPFYEELQEKYADRDVVVFNLYVREPHAGERGFPELRNHESYEHKAGYAQEMARIKSMRTHILVDGMDQKVHAMLGDLPNTIWLIGKDGKVAYKCTWSNAEHVDAQLAHMVNADPAFKGKPKMEHTIFTARAGTAI